MDVPLTNEKSLNRSSYNFCMYIFIICFIQNFETEVSEQIFIIIVGLLVVLQELFENSQVRK